MKPFHILARAQTPDGAQLTLQEHDGDYYLKLAGRQLMSTTATVSEELLGVLACQRLRTHAGPQVLIGGLGFGFTLKTVLATVGADAKVRVAELIPEVTAWNRELLQSVNGKLLDDPRVEILTEDVFAVIAKAAKGSYDAILLDIDDGPVSFIKGKKSYRYDHRGCGRILRALAPGGRAAFWSAAEDQPFKQKLSRGGFQVEVREVKAHEHAKRNAHRIYLAERYIHVPDTTPAAGSGGNAANQRGPKRSSGAIPYSRRALIPGHDIFGRVPASSGFPDDATERDGHNKTKGV